MSPAIVPLLYLAACVTNCVTVCGVTLSEPAYDADTFKVDLPPGTAHPIFTKGLDVRIHGIDAPEMDGKGPCESAKAVVARDFVRGVLAKAKSVDLYDLQKDKYFRVLGTVIVDKKSLGQMLLDVGLAVQYDGSSKKNYDWCGDAPKVIK